MIVVVADDFSGASEIAGVAFRRGFRVELQTKFDPRTDAEMVVIDAATRSLSTVDAARRITSIATAVRQANPEWIYKKVDSVLRGHVLAEIEATASVFDFCRTVLAPANPGHNRVVTGGSLVVNGVPVHRTAFANDPEHPIRSSRVVEILGGTADSTVRSVASGELLPAAGFVVADATSRADLQRLAMAADARTLLVGAAEFFEAVLDARQTKTPRLTPPVTPLGRCLLICGSHAAWERRRKDCKHGNVPVLVPPLGEIEGTLPNERMMLALGEFKPKADSHALVESLVGAARGLMSRHAFSTIIIEGGTTASSFVRRTGYVHLDVSDDFGPGIVGLCNSKRESPLPRLITKPGSYDWPASLRNSFFGQDPKSTDSTGPPNDDTLLAD